MKNVNFVQQLDYDNKQLQVAMALDVFDIFSSSGGFYHPIY